MEKYQEVKAEHPRAVKNVESGLNILSVIPQAKATQVGTKAALKTTKTAVKPVLKAVDKAGDALGDLPRRMEQTNLRLTPVQKQTLGKKLNDVTQFIVLSVRRGAETTYSGTLSAITGFRKLTAEVPHLGLPSWAMRK